MIIFTEIKKIINWTVQKYSSLSALAIPRYPVQKLENSATTFIIRNELFLSILRLS